jgi:hypothetical protein
MAYYNKDINALYLHIPKCYGTHISSNLMKMGFIQIVQPNFNIKKGGMLQLVVDTTSIINKDTFIFTFIRNPIDRLISACNYCKVDINSLYTVVSINVDNSQESLTTPKIKLVQNSFKLKHPTKPILHFNYWHIFKPQIQHLIVEGSENKYNISFIGKCENIEQDWNKLLSIFTERGFKNIIKFDIKNMVNKSIKNPKNKEYLIYDLIKNQINIDFKKDFDLYSNPDILKF